MRLTIALTLACSAYPLDLDALRRGDATADSDVSVPDARLVGGDDDAPLRAALGAVRGTMRYDATPMSTRTA